MHRNQYGFIKSRTIQDCLGWSFEFLHQCKASGNACVVLKLDFEKAFDTMEHSTILKIMECKGFDERWIMWMQNILAYGSSAVLLNGVVGSEFHCKRGVRQGDPLSPLLFVLTANMLKSMINAAWQEGLLTLPIEQPASEDYPVIQYADDTILILPACLDQRIKVKEIL